MNINFKRLKYTYVKTTLFTLFACTLFLKGYTVFEKTGQNYFHVFVNGKEIGTIGDAQKAEELLLTARKNVASGSEELTFIDAQMTMEDEEVLWGKVDDEETILEQMETVLKNSIVETMHRSYTLKVNEYMVNLASVDEVKSLLRAAVDKYGGANQFAVELVHDAEREFNVLTADVVNIEEKKAEADTVAYFSAGVENLLKNVGENAQVQREKDFQDYSM